MLSISQWDTLFITCQYQLAETTAPVIPGTQSHLSQTPWTHPHSAKARKPFENGRTSTHYGSLSSRFRDLWYQFIKSRSPISAFPHICNTHSVQFRNLNINNCNYHTQWWTHCSSSMPEAGNAGHAGSLSEILKLMATLEKECPIYIKIPHSKMLPLYHHYNTLLTASWTGPRTRHLTSFRQKLLSQHQESFRCSHNAII